MTIRFLARVLLCASPMLAVAGGLHAQSETDLPPLSATDEQVGRLVEMRVTNEAVGGYHDVLMDLRMQQVVNGLLGPSRLEAPRPHFLILDSPVPNVFGAPYETLFITRGMLEQLRDDDELAVVLAHAIGHQAAGHDRWSPGLRARLAAIRVSDALLGPGFASATEEPLSFQGLGLRFLLRAYTPAEERTADSIAATLFAGSPYAARTGAGVLEALARDEARDLFPAFARTHPAYPGRAERLAAAPPPSGAPRAIRLTLPLDSTLLGFIAGERGFLGFVAGGAYYRVREPARIGLPPLWTARMLGGYLSATSPAAHAVLVLRGVAAEGAEGLAQQYQDIPGGARRIAPLAFQIDRKPVFWWQDALPGGGTRIVAFFETTGVGWQITGIADAAGVQELQQAVQWMIREARAPMPGETPPQPRLALLAVQRAATLRELAAPFAREDVPIAAIARLNRLDSGAVVPAGTRLRIPVVASVADESQR
ncbi:M48 family metalloprotease [Longimicrobium sp.]|uniref:M48 family metalloprotease n=1 Tax=Longimicrobium sp. TaxID=2029185 RepID=UPI002BA7EA8C|nr:M48 family metalloprotease [Longimicrobium sp.]HSU12757.1 M48 family metalloprotease [Longimicrobium sp.]